VIIYESCGHVPMLEKPNEVKEDVIRFLSAN
jgi:pimeloyl-ACP methyl ester carboxylesterase